MKLVFTIYLGITCLNSFAQTGYLNLEYDYSGQAELFSGVISHEDKYLTVGNSSRPGYDQLVVIIADESGNILGEDIFNDTTSAAYTGQYIIAGLGETFYLSAGALTDSGNFFTLVRYNPDSGFA